MKSVIQKLVLIGTSLILCLILGEVAVRLVGDDIYSESNIIFNQHHSVLGWAKIPGIKGMRVSDVGEYAVHESINSKGLRGPDYDYPKPAGTRRVLVLGDSFVEGYQVSEDHLFTGVLEKLLNWDGMLTYEVINAGTNGYSTDQELIFFRTEGIQYKPDVTILMFYLNDVWFNSLSEIWISNEPEPTYKPVFDIVEGGGIKMAGVPVPERRDTTVANIHEVEKPSLFTRFKNLLSSNLYLYKFTSQRIKNSPRLHRLAIEFGLAKPPALGQMSKDRDIVPVPDAFRVWENDLYPEIVNAWKVTEAIISQLRKDTAAAGSELVVFYIPSIVEINPEFWEDTRRIYDLSAEEWSESLICQEIAGIFERNGIPLIDPTEQFIEATKTHELYFIEDRHWNASGHELVARLLKDKLIDLVNMNY